MFRDDNWQSHSFRKYGCPLKAFFDSTTDEWFNVPRSKLGGVFTSTSSMHGDRRLH